jgi:hypothetical protein
MVFWNWKVVAYMYGEAIGVRGGEESSKKEAILRPRIVIRYIFKETTPILYLIKNNQFLGMHLCWS